MWRKRNEIELDWRRAEKAMHYKTDFSLRLSLSVRNNSFSSSKKIMGKR